MVASPKLSPWFYMYATENRCLPSRDDLPSAAPHRPAASGRPRGFAAGSQPRKRFTPEQRQTLIDLLKETGRATETQRRFTEDGHGAVRRVTLWQLAKLTR